MNLGPTTPPVRSENEGNEQPNGSLGCFSSALTPIIITGGRDQVNHIVDDPQSKCYPSQQATPKRQFGKVETYAAPDPMKSKKVLPLSWFPLSMQAISSYASCSCFSCARFMSVFISPSSESESWTRLWLALAPAVTGKCTSAVHFIGRPFWLTYVRPQDFVYYAASTRGKQQELE